MGRTPLELSTVTRMVFSPGMGLKFWCSLLGWVSSFGVLSWDGSQVLVFSPGMGLKFWCSLLGWVSSFGVLSWDGSQVLPLLLIMKKLSLTSSKILLCK